MQPDPELAVAYGVFSVRQAKDAGHDAATIARHVRRGKWVRVERGILRSRELLPQDELVLAVLRAGPRAVAGFESAAHLHGWDAVERPPAPRLILPLQGCDSAGYRTRLRSDEITLRGVVPATTPERTALDLAATNRFDSAVILLDSALRSGQVVMESLVQQFAGRRRSGITCARRALAHVDPGSGSVAETEARLLFARAGLPAPRTQYVIRTREGTFRVDFAWVQARLIVEIDGFAYHSATGDFQRDRTRQNSMQLDGWLVLRFTVADLRNDPERVLREIRRALAR